MPRSRSVVDSTSAFGPASVRMVSLRAGMPSTRMRQSMVRRAMSRRYPSWDRLRQQSRSNIRPEAPLGAHAGSGGRFGAGVAPLSGRAAPEAAARPAALRAPLGAADAALARLRVAAEAPFDLSALHAAHQSPAHGRLLPLSAAVANRRVSSGHLLG